MLKTTEQQRWQRVKGLVDEALDLPPTERPAFLDRACDDAELRREVELLLVREDRLGGFLEQPFFELQPDVDPDLNRQLGPYRLVRRLGSGGMGAVYLAERTDGEVRQQVAIKLLKRGLDSEEMVRRFQIERQILANLTHPYIARLLDVGTAEDGRPFFAMEFVEGEPIDAWCAASELDLRQRIGLFRQVCEAIHFAHQNLVVHRDLKPANILVTGDGTPRLLDFGIAKLLDQDSALPAVTVASGVAPLSLAYASPEQLAGESITTAADIFGLGVVLFELLVGRRPFRPEGLGPQKMAQFLRRTQPQLPSDAMAAADLEDSGDREPQKVARSAPERRRLVRSLRGDLDNIVVKALSAEPERRFLSAEQLSEDLRRYLDGLPVRSRPDSFFYRAGKFVRRNALAVTAAAGVAILVLGFGIAMAVQRQQIALQNQEIVRERDRANWVMEFLVHLAESPDPNRARGESLTLESALNAGVERLHREFADQPEIRAALLDAMGSSYRHLLIYGQSRELLEQALDLRRGLYGDDHALTAETLHNLASLESAERNWATAEQLMRRALEIQERRFPDGHRDLARGLNNLAFLLMSRGQEPAEAEALARLSLEMKERLFGSEHAELTNPLSTLATLLRARGELEEAEVLYRRCLALRRRLEGPMSPGLAKVLHALAALVIERGDPVAAEPLCQESLAIRRNLYTGDHPLLASSLNQLGRVRILVDEAELAAASLEEAAAMARRLGGGDRSSALVATIEKNLAWARLAAGQFGSCEELAREVLGVFEERQSARRAAEAKSLLGGCLAGLGRSDEAAPLLREGYASLLESVGEEALVTRLAQDRLESFRAVDR